MGVKHIRADQISTEDGLVISGNVNLINGTFFTDGARFTGDWVKDENENVSREGKVGVSKDTVDNSENSANLQVSGDIDFTGDLYQNGVLFTAIIGSSPWSNLAGESNIYFTAGDVSIGTNNGNAKLHVDGNVYASSNLEVGSANLFVDTETSRIGVNTRSPAATLHVEGNVYASSNLEVGSANLFVDTETSRIGVNTRSPAATLHVEGNVYASSNLEVGSANLFVDTETSRIGVNTRSPAATLHVEGNVYASSNLEVGSANLFVDTETSRIGVNTGSPAATLHVEGNVYASSNLEVGSANLFVDTETSRIGVNTGSPAATLHVEGNVYASSNLEVGSANLFVDTETSRIGVNTGSPAATLHVEGNVYASSNLEVGSANLFVDTETSRIGVNTRSPAATLHVEGNVHVSSNLTASGNVGIGGAASGTNKLKVHGTVEASSFIGIQDVNVPNLDASIITSGIFDTARTGATSVTVLTVNDLVQGQDTGIRIPNGGCGFVIVQKKRSSNTGPPYYSGNPVYTRDAPGISLYVVSGGTSGGTATDGSFCTFLKSIHNDNEVTPTMYISQVNSSQSKIMCLSSSKNRGCTVVISYCPLIIP
jgi:hypothetical protein